VPLGLPRPGVAVVGCWERLGRSARGRRRWCPACRPGRRRRRLAGGGNGPRLM